MIRIGKIDDKLSIFQNKQTVIWGTGEFSVKIYRYLKYFNINVTVFCDNDKSKWGGGYLGGRIISPNELLELCEKYSVVVAIGCGFDNDISDQLEDMGITDYVTCGEMFTKFTTILLRDRICRSVNRDMYNEKNGKVIGRKIVYDYIVRNPDNDYLFLCLPTKTGDHSLMRTLESIHYPYLNFYHSPEWYEHVCDILGDRFSNSKIKVITAVREPISQNLSWMYQYIASGARDYPEEFIDDITYWEGGGDAQKMFCKFMDEYVENSLPVYERKQIHELIQNFIPLVSEKILNLLEFEFNKNIGFSIIKKNNTEIFVYQVEKLGTIWHELCDWLGIDEVQMINDNVGDEKWYAKSYQQAKKEIEITQEYFDKCYSEPYVKHFYSDEDIQKFKNKWETHIIHQI